MRNHELERGSRAGDDQVIVTTRRKWRLTHRMRANTPAPTARRHEAGAECAPNQTARPRMRALAHPQREAQNAGTGTPTARSPECGHWHAQSSKPRMRALRRPNAGPPPRLHCSGKAQKTDLRSSFTTCGAHFVTAQLHKVSESESRKTAPCSSRNH